MENEKNITGERNGNFYLEYQPSINYAMVRNGVKTVIACSLENGDTADWPEAKVMLVGESVEPQTLQVDSVPAGGSRLLDELRIEPQEEVLRNLTEKQETAFTVIVQVGGSEVFRRNYPVVLEPDEYYLHFDETETTKTVTKQTIWERKLLDFSLRNNLINCKLGKRVIPFVSFDIHKLEDQLHTGKDFQIVPYPDKLVEPQKSGMYNSPVQAAALRNKVPDEFVENRRITSYLSETELRNGLKFIYRASRNALEENGANTLYIVLGLLKWYESEKSTLPRYAPIVMLPVEIVRKAGQDFVIRARDEDTVINVTLIELIKQQFKIDLSMLDPLPTDESGVDILKVMNTVRRAIAEQEGWAVMEEAVLGLFSFNKFVMWNDIHTGAEKLKQNEVVKSLMEGRVALKDAGEVVDAREIDKNAQPSDFCIPIDVDSSQMEAVVESGRGKSFILYGPPGTGKSQTITNMIANALYQNKRVLFVAEKMAALEVVQKRLAKIGLDPFCLELHSNKVTKSHFLQQMQKALDVVHVKEPEEYKAMSDKLFAHRQQLITYIESLHKKQPSGLSLYDCITEYLSVEGDEIRLADEVVAAATKEQMQQWQEEIEHLATVFQVSGTPATHPLRGFYPAEWSAELPATVKAELEKMQKKVNTIAHSWFLPRYFAKKYAAKFTERYGTSIAYDDEGGAQLKAWMEHIGQLKDWTLWTEARQKLIEQGLKPVADAIEERNITPRQAAEALHKGICHQLTMKIVDNDASLARFNGLLFEELVNRYKQETYSFMDLSKKELYCRMAARIPSQTMMATANSEMGILKRNIQNGGRGTSIRKIIDQIPTLMPKLCPCMLMSPISVAQYIDIDAEKFDLVIFDEASQMPTSEAVGAIARGKALICVGDPKQMPPTSFFSTQQVDEDEVEIDDMESILDDCITLSMPGHYLSWHYRSKHESLIAFSNLQYYESRLHTFPSIDDQQSKVRLVQVEGEYDKGRTRSNPAEARAIVDEIIRRLSDPELSQRSIGVVSFSKVQQNLIEDMLIEELSKHLDLEQKAYSGEEPIFIKNLENVQGDERDVILFSVGYGPDKEGRVSMNFGPLNNEGGERRLNVAVSRARYEMIVFATLHAEQIDLNRSQAKGVEGLKNFIEFAGKGTINHAAAAVAEEQGGTDLVSLISGELRAKGYEVRTHVGRSQFKIDIAVVNSDKPDEYMLGILCDGKNYYETKTTRDREIVQPNVLTGLSWNVMRVWAVDWYANHEQVMQRILSRLEDIKHNVKHQDEEVVAAQQQASKTFDASGLKTEYVSEYHVPRNLQDRDIRAFPDEEIRKAVLYAVEQSVSIPLEELKKQTSRLLGFSRRSPRSDAAVDRALEFLEVMDKVTIADGMITVKS